MKYIVLRNTVAGGRVRLKNSVVELEDSEARELMQMGRVAPHHEEKAQEDRSLGLAEETKPRRRGRPKKSVN